MGDKNRRGISRTVVKRIHTQLSDRLDGISKTNKINFVDASKMVADILVAKEKKHKVTENIRREIEF